MILYSAMNIWNIIVR